MKFPLPILVAVEDQAVAVENRAVAVEDRAAAAAVDAAAAVIYCYWPGAERAKRDSCEVARKDNDPSEPPS